MTRPDLTAEEMEEIVGWLEGVASLGVERAPAALALVRDGIRLRKMLEAGPDHVKCVRSTQFYPRYSGAYPQWKHDTEGGRSKFVPLYALPDPEPET